MKKQLRIAIFLCAPVLFCAVQSHAEGLPQQVTDAIDSAYATGNEFVIDAVVSKFKSQSPDYAEVIDAYASSVALGDVANIPEENLSDLAPAAGGNKKDWEGSLEAGANFQNGNSKEQSLGVKGDVTYDYGEWANTLKFSADTSESNNIRQNEEYRVSNQARLKLSDKDYTFAEIGYVNDRFSGFEYRISETVGYGRELYKDSDFLWSGEVGVGARQTNPTVGSNENSVLGTAQTKGEWKISKTLGFTQEFKSAFTTENSISESHSALKSSLSDNLYLKLGVDIEHIGDAPSGSKHTDTKTGLTVGYEL